MRLRGAIAIFFALVLSIPAVAQGVGQRRAPRQATGQVQRQVAPIVTPRNYTVLELHRIDPALVADIFGGSVIYNTTAGAGRTGGGTGSGYGYGSGARTGGRGDYDTSSYGTNRSSGTRTGGRSSSFSDIYR